MESDRTLTHRVHSRQNGLHSACDFRRGARFSIQKVCDLIERINVSSGLGNSLDSLLPVMSITEKYRTENKLQIQK